MCRSSETTNGINIGYRGSATTDLDGSGTNTVSISAKFLNLLADGTSGSDPDVSYVRCNQPTSTTTTCDMAFGTSMDDALKASIIRSEEHTSELQSHVNLVCRLLLEK